MQAGEAHALDVRVELREDVVDGEALVQLDPGHLPQRFREGEADHDSAQHSSLRSKGGVSKQLET